jgi:hypothetical protein
VIVNSRLAGVGVALAFALALQLDAGPMFAEEVALKLRAAGADASGTPLTIEVLRWSTDSERAQLLQALAPPPPAAGRAGPAPAGRGGARGGRAGRGGRAAAPPASPMVRLTGAIRTAPTVGFIWGEGPTGYSIKYAWRAVGPDGQQRIVLATDRRFGPHIRPPSPQVAPSDAEADFTLIEMRLNAKGSGEGKTSLATAVTVDAEATTLALEGYASSPSELKVTP